MHSPETERARELRNNMSGTERRVWYCLRGRRLAGFKFRRQLPIGPYFADFVCLSARLVVEIDGEFHKEESDRRKTAYLESQRFRVMRIPASDTDQHLDDVMESIFWELHETPPSPHPDPPRQAGRGNSRA
jgi:very-short-patch-repair endonuclease